MTGDSTAYLGAKVLLDREEGGPPGYYALLSDALRDELIDKGIITASQVRREIERLEARVEALRRQQAGGAPP